MDFKNFSPCFLIAMPELRDPNFEKTVVLLTSYNENGAVGFVLNRRTTLTLGSALVLSEGALNPRYHDHILWSGGPVEPDKIWILYEHSQFPALSNSNRVGLNEKISLTYDIDILTNLEKSLPQTQMRVFHGYSGWAANQLESELAVSAWITAPLLGDLVFSTSVESVWDTAIKNLGFDPYKLVGPNSSFLN